MHITSIAMLTSNLADVLAICTQDNTAGLACFYLLSRCSWLQLYTDLLIIWAFSLVFSLKRIDILGVSF